MAATANGFPYPVGTDLVRDGDNAIKALAEAVDARFKCVRINGAVDGLGTITTTFTSPTGAAPRAVQVQVIGDDSWAPTVMKWNPSVITATATAVTLRVWNSDSGFNMAAGTAVVFDVLLVF
jgi:hypothetical protein